MQATKIIFLCTGIIALCGCSSLKNSAKYGFLEGYYRSRIFHKKKKKVYVVPGEETIKIYSAKSLQKDVVDTSRSLKIAFPSDQKPSAFQNYKFTKNSFDVDVLTIPIKYRPAVKDFPGNSIPVSMVPCTWVTVRMCIIYRTGKHPCGFSKDPLRIMDTVLVFSPESVPCT